MQLQPGAEDIISGEALAFDSRVSPRFVRFVNSFRPDVVQFEQLYPYLGFKQVEQHLKVQPRLVYSAQNVEFSMKKQVYRVLELPTPDARRLLEVVERGERELTRRAEVVAAVTPSDVAAFETLGARRVVLAPNGADEQRFRSTDRKYWMNYLGRRGIHRCIVFVGSYHAPNWEGFEKLVGPHLGFLPRSTRLLIVGAVSEYFVRNYQDLERCLFWRRAVAVGRISAKRLAALLAMADCIILPLVSGGGSNLKTPEALLSGATIVATTHAMRGFEKWSHLPNVVLADEPTAFRASILKATSRRRAGDRVSADVREALSWQECLRAFVQEVRAV